MTRALIARRLSGKRKTEVKVPPIYILGTLNFYVIRNYVAFFTFSYISRYCIRLRIAYYLHIRIYVYVTYRKLLEVIYSYFGLFLEIYCPTRFRIRIRSYLLQL